METQSGTKVPADGETISDIQNYLASFNKEIEAGTTQTLQDGTSNGASVHVTPVTTASGQTYYVTEAGSEANVAGYTATYESSTGQFNGTEGTFYQTTAQYYATGAESEQADVQYAAVGSFHPRNDVIQSDSKSVAPGSATLIGSGVSLVTSTGKNVPAASIPGRNAGIGRIVVAARDQVNESEAREISVTIPAALAAEAAGEELLQAVEAQSLKPEQAYVAMQPDGQQVMVSSGGGAHVVNVSGNNSGSTRQNSARSQTIRMVVQHPDGTERQQDVEVPTTDGEMSNDASGAAIVSQGTLEMMANLAEQASEGEVVSGMDVDEATAAGQQVLLNSGNTYQTVTIVPSDSNAGEVSYVLIVSQPDDEKEPKSEDVDVDMSVYDFNEGEQQGGHISGDVNDAHGNVSIGVACGSGGGTTTKSPRVIKISSKKSQSVTQAHMCNYCNYTSPKRYLLSRHMKSHSEERPHKCSVCERGFKTLASLQNHVNTHTGTRPHQCKECDSAFTTSGELVRHVRYKHTHEKPHRCTECDYASVELSKLKRHMRCHTGERPYQCPHCTYASPDTYKLKRHLRIHTGEKPYECDICHARFTQSNSLKAHKLIHTGNKPIFQCELCPTTCGRKTDLRIHVQKLHTSDKPLKCRRCGKSFPDRYTYKVHSKTHEGEKCFKCDLCTYASISQRHLESHMLIHTDQKPYQCDQCEQAFRQKQLLKRHKNLYHDPNYVPPIPKEKTHECPECARPFRHKGNLIRHMAIHDPDATQQEKEAAMQVTTRRTKKRINEDGVEEEYSEEEEEEDFDDEDDYDDDEDDDDGNDMDVGSRITTADGQQVVVLEVIQLQGPEGEQAVAVLSEGMEMVDESGTVTGTATVVNEGDMMEAATDGMDGLGTTYIVETAKKGRRPGARIKIDPLTIDEAENGNTHEGDAYTVNSRPIRGRRRKAEDDDDYIYSSPMKKVRKSGNANVLGSNQANRGKKSRLSGTGEITPIEELDPVMPTEEELARREAEAKKRRQEQKQKDLEECFGFKDDEDEVDDDEVNSSGGQLDTSATESAIRLLAAMQGDEHVHD